MICKFNPASESDAAGTFSSVCSEARIKKTKMKTADDVLMIHQTLTSLLLRLLPVDAEHSVPS